ncbi:MAG: hypothetical protein E6Q97_32320 [Desulfurellales bacterium]|nr:MAG: hypothetical protein E6Q97_32320 [Desulfurellales bacterium]
MTVPNILANGPGNWPDANKFMDNFDYVDAVGRGVYLSNPGFETWTGGTSFTNPASGTAVADGWTWAKAGTTAPTANVSREPTTKDSGLYSLKVDITVAGSGDSNGEIHQSNLRYASFAGLTVVLGARVRASTANKVRLKVYDGVTTAYSSYHTGDGTWQTLYVALTVSASPTQLKSSLMIDPADFTGQIYYDGSFLYVVRPSMSTAAKASLTLNPPDSGDLSNDIASVQTSVASINTQLTKMGIHNRLINGGFAVNQRGATSVADDTYHLDRWYALNESGNVTIAQQTDQENGQPTSLRMTQPDVAAKRIGVAQIVESINCRDMRGGNVVLSARIRSSLGQAIRYAILEHTGTADTVTSDVVGTWSSGTYTPSNFFIAGLTVVAVGATTPTAATWTSISLSGAVSASCNNLIVVFWTEGTFAQNATLDIGKAQLESGSTATAFEYLPIHVLLALCSRYCPRWAVPSGGEFGSGGLTGANGGIFRFQFYVPARVAPTGISATASVWTLSSMGAGAASTGGSLSFRNATADNASVTVSGGTGGGGAAGAAAVLNASSAAFIEFTGVEL